MSTSYSTKEAATVISILFVESIFVAAFFLGMDKDVNGMENAFSLQVIPYVFFFALLFLFPLVLLYSSYRFHGVRQAVIMLGVLGLILGVISSAGAGSGDYNRILYFFIRSGFMMTVVAVCVSLAVLTYKLVSISSKKLKSTH